MKTSATRTARLLVSGALVSLGLLAILLFPAAVSHAEINMQADQCDGTYYTVRRGDSWSVISRRVGVPVADLRLANPQARRRNDVVYAGERLCIPSRQETRRPKQR
jgi:hypothetical protein